MNQQQVQEKINRHLSFLAQDENNLKLLIEISDLYSEAEELEKAQMYLDKANLIDQDACLGHQGLLYLNQGKLQEAQNCFIKALSYGDTPALRYNLGFTYYITFDFEKAWEVLAPTLQGEHYPEAKLLMARILHRQDSINEAIELINQVLEQNPEDAEALGLLALLYFDLNEDKLAEKNSQLALKIDADNYDARLVSVLLRLITQETTVEEIEDLIQVNSQDSRLWFALGNTYMIQGEMDKAEQNLQKAIEIYPDFYDCHIVLAWCQLLNDRIDEAHATYLTATQIVDEIADAWGGLGLIAALQEDFLKAEQLITKAKNLNPECFLTQVADAIYYNHKNPAKAKRNLVKALTATKVPVSQQLAFIIEEIENSQQVH